MQSPGPYPQDPEAETRRVAGTPTGSRPESVYPGGAESHDDGDWTRVAGEGSGGYQPRHGRGREPGRDTYPIPDYRQPGYQQDHPGLGDHRYQGYQQRGYDQQEYDQQEYDQNYQQPDYQQGYPTDAGYPQGYPPTEADRAYLPPGPGPADGPRPGGSGHRRAIIIGAIAAAALLIVVSLVLLAGGSDDARPVATATPGASPTIPANPTAMPSVIPSPSPSPAFTPAESELLAKLNSAAMTDCKPNGDTDGDHILASLYCNSDDGKVVAAYAYATAADLTGDVDLRKSLVTTTGGACKEGGSEVFTWRFDPSRIEGTTVCTVRESKHFVFWSYDDKLVSFMATGTDGVALYEWWSGFDPVPQS